MFEGKVAVITGGARGIGRATADILSANGAQVLIADVDTEAAEGTAAALHGAATSWSGDLTAEGAAEQVIEAAIGEFGRIDIVVNNAGYTLDAPLHKMSDADFRAMLEIHTVVPFQLLRAAAPYLRDPAKRERSEGAEVFRKVVNVASVAAYGNPGQSNYAAAKSGLLGLTKTLAREWAPLRINVNAVSFGVIDTRLTRIKSADSAIDIAGARVKVGIPEFARTALEELVPLGRAGTAAEAAGAIAFLCSPWSAYVSGQVLNVSGGLPFAMGPA